MASTVEVDINAATGSIGGRVQDGIHGALNRGRRTRLVELEVLDPPRSWAIDSVEELLPKLDKSELIELVLIPLLLCASASGARGS